MEKKKLYKWELVLLTGKKTCSKCKVEKPVNKFSKNKSNKDGYSDHCIECYNLYYVEPKREERLSYWRTRRETKREKIREYNKSYNEKNREKVRERQQVWYNNNKEEVKQRVKENHYARRENDILYDLICHMRLAIYRYVKNKTKRTHEIIGCSPEELRNHIESLWQTGMSWENHTHTGWHIDHIIPSSSAKTEEEVYALNHYTNFQPLWAKDNLKKSNKII